MVASTPLGLFLLLVMGHCLCDYPLQTTFIAQAKCRRPDAQVPWVWVMLGHAGTHGLAVALLTGSIALGVAETVVHGFIDDAKCRGLINFNQDQTLHVLCKLVWVLLLPVLPWAL